MSILVALLGNAVLAAVGVTDKFILTKTVSKPVVFVFYSTIFILAFFLVLPFGFVYTPSVWTDYLIFFISGGCFFFALWAMYSAIQESEVSRASPLIGAVAPFFILFLSRFFLYEQLTRQSLVGAGFLILGSLIISFEKKQTPGMWQDGLGWAVLSGLLFAISHVASKYAFDSYGFISGFVWTKLPIGVFAASLPLLSADVRALFIKKPDALPQKMPKKKQVLFVGLGVGLGVVATILLQYAMSLGSVSLVNAMSGVQYALLIIFVAIISKFFPFILKETFTRRQIIHKAAAVTVIAFGLLLLVL